MSGYLDIRSSFFGSVLVHFSVSASRRIPEVIEGVSQNGGGWKLVILAKQQKLFSLCGSAVGEYWVWARKITSYQWRYWDQLRVHPPNCLDRGVSWLPETVYWVGQRHLSANLTWCTGEPAKSCLALSYPMLNQTGLVSEGLKTKGKLKKTRATAHWCRGPKDKGYGKEWDIVSHYQPYITLFLVSKVCCLACQFSEPSGRVGGGCSVTHSSRRCS